VKWGITCLLVVLIGVNVAWVATAGGSWPLLGVAAYGVIVVLVLRWRDYRAAFAAGVLGFAVHLSRLLLGGAPADRSDLVLLLVNTALPVGVFMLALQAWRTRRAG
jgi:hypothetical protein